ncbi:MAG TPA: FtsX-like permease family protein [Solirubrobacteraceae bacterium]|nr:FtsX-like permease family protein [Solirubrobacteraceae bacterium]
MRSARDLLSLRVFGLRVSVLFGLYRQRLKYHAVRELLAGGGIAVGVALVFGVLLANGSVLGSAREIVHAVDGSASLELAARSPHGFSQRLADQAERLPGVQDAALLLRENAVIEGPRGSRSVQLVGVTAGLIGLRGSATKDLGSGALLLGRGVGLPSGVAESIGAQTDGTVTLLVGGAAHTTRVRVVLNAGAIGSLSTSGLVVARLPVAQALAGQPGRVTEVLIRATPGRERLVAGELRRLAAGKVDVLPADAELSLLNETAKPTNQSSALFAAISLMVGFLLALNAMLLIVPERRREIAEMRSQGYDSKQVLVVFAFQAVALGIVASLVGVVVGDILARTLFESTPIYLSVAFPISGQQGVHLATVLIAVGAGVAAALVASLVPILIDLASKGPVDAVLNRGEDAGQEISAGVMRRLAIAGAVVVLCVTIAVRIAPVLTVAGGVALALASLCFIPLVFRTVTRVLRQYARKRHGGMLAVAVIELDAGATRAVALAGIAALAVYGSTAVDGARRDLTHGLDRTFAEYIGTADIWVTTSGNNLTVNSFPADRSITEVARAPGVGSVRVDQGEYLDVGARRMWVIARPRDGRTILPAGQLLEGSMARATGLLRQGGWAAVSSAFAAEHHLRVGDTFALPTPAGPARFGVAAITTNIGWPPGTITLNTGDYSRYWQTGDPAALEINLKPGVSAAEGKREVESALQGRPGLRVQTMSERISQFQHNASQGLHSLAEIASLLLLTASLALAAALSTVIYQRRAQFVSLKEDGFDRWQLCRGLLIESVVLIGIGCLDGAILGLYGHALANRYLRLDTGFPAPFSLGALQLVLTLLIVAGVSLAVIALPGYSAAGVPTTRPSFRE